MFKPQIVNNGQVRLWVIIALLVLIAATLTGCDVFNQMMTAGLSSGENETTTSTGTVDGQGVYVSGLPNRGAAPQIRSNTWLNADRPLRLESLRGQVVLVEFWTYDCINCIRTLPYVEGWYQTYKDQGFTVLGIHFPEFQYEHDLQNVRAAAQRLNVNYPIGIDNDGLTWRSYGQRYWPTMYLIDKGGNIRYMHIGEGQYAQMERNIQDLLAETYSPADSAAAPDFSYVTPNIDLNVRSGPGTNHDLIGAVNPGMAFVVLNRESGWYQISYNDGVGYVSGEYVTLHE